MEKKEYDDLIKLLTFVVIQNSTILQLILDPEHGYKKNAYKTVHKEMIKEWEKQCDESKNTG